MLERFSLATPLDEFAKSIEFGVGEGAVEVQVQLHPRHVEKMRQEQFSLKPRRIDLAFGEEFRAALDDFQDCHRHNVKMATKEGKGRRRTYGTTRLRTSGPRSTMSGAPNQGLRVECSIIQKTSWLLAEGTFRPWSLPMGGVVLGSLHLWISEWPSTNETPPAPP